MKWPSNTNTNTVLLLLTLLSNNTNAAFTASSSSHQKKQNAAVRPNENANKSSPSSPRSRQFKPPHNNKHARPSLLSVLDDAEESSMSIAETTAQLRAGNSPSHSSSSSKEANKHTTCIAIPWREMLAEAIGTGIIVHLGCGTVCSALYKSAHTGLFQIAAVWGLAVTLAIYCTGGISGAHLNPAMTLSFCLLRGFPARKLPWYILAQLCGAMTAAGANYLLYAADIAKFESLNNIVRGTAESYTSASAFGEYFGVDVGWKLAFAAEGLGTAILAFLICAVTNEENSKNIPSQCAPMLIGAMVVCLISVIAPLTQAGLNPARDFGPRVVAWLWGGWGRAVSFRGWWVYVLAPLVGAPLGAFVAERLLWVKSKSVKKDDE